MRLPVLLLTLLALPAFAADRPNFVYVLCDDLGYGDVGALHPRGRIPTPHLDRLAREGMVFTDAHSGSAVCTPTRYGILTGRYAWRTRLRQGVLGGVSAPLIPPERTTVATLLRAQGYRTSAIGKWHLGLGWARRPGAGAGDGDAPAQVAAVDFSRPFAGGPLELGFERFFGISASLDMVPYTFLEGDRVAVLPTEVRDDPMVWGRPEGRTRRGPAAPGFAVDQVLPELTRRAVAAIREGAAEAKQGRPFFLYLAYASPHTPVAPTPAWRGRSGLNAYADFVMETDDAIGRVLEALEASGAARETVVIVTSDNGCSPQADFPGLAARGHDPSGGFRGMKADIFEGGHRIPFLVRWPGRVRAGSRSDATICLTDFLRTAAELAGAPVPDHAGEDSVSLVPELLGRGDGGRREATVHHSINGSFAIRQGRWKLALCPGSGGWSAPRPGVDDVTGQPAVQLFDLEADPGERKNLQAAHPEVVARLTALLERYVREGRSTPGAGQANDVPVDIHRAVHPAPRPAKAGKA